MRDDVIVRTATAYLELAKVRHSLDLMRAEQASGEKILQVDPRESWQRIRSYRWKSRAANWPLARIQERIVKLEDREDVLDQQIRDLTGISDSQSIQVEQDGICRPARHRLGRQSESQMLPCRAKRP